MIRLFNASFLAMIAVGFVVLSLSHAAVFYVDPERGDMAGDTILLRSGYHGEICSRGAYNDDYITISDCRGAVIVNNLAYNPYGGP